MQNIHATIDIIQNCEERCNSYPKSDDVPKLVS